MARADKNSIKEYLLGRLTEAEEEQVEMRLLTEPEFAEEYDIVVNEVIDDYISGKFEGEEPKKVEDHFFKSQQRRNKLKFALALKLRKSEMVTPKPRIKNYTPYLAIAAAILVVVGAGLGVRKVFFSQSDLNKGLAALRSAFKDERPTEARLSDFTYAPVANQRGGRAKVDYLQRDLAASLLLKEVSEHPSAASHHGLGQYYLAERQFDKAIDQLDQAQKLNNDNARIHSDLGAAFLEKARDQSLNRESSERSELFAKSLEHFDRALAINSALPEALFNRGLCHQSMMLLSQAEEDWRKYLAIDSTSPWAEEARRNLKALEERRQTRASENSEQIVGSILHAYKLADAENAWRVISRNREVITGRLVSFALVSTYLHQLSQGQNREAHETLQALRFAAEIERERSGDRYAEEIARYYERLPQHRVGELLAAQQFQKEGFASCLQSRFADALEKFNRAGQIFSREQNEPEARAIEYWISYCYYQLTRTKESFAILDSLAIHCEKEQYKWLLSQALNLLATVHTAFNDYSAGIEYSKKALAVSEQIGDSYGSQKNLAQLANQEKTLGSYRQSLIYIQQCLEFANAEWPGPRQMWRTYDTASRVFYSLGSYSAAAAYGREALTLALVDIKDPSMIYVSQVHLGLTYGRQKNYDEGIKHARLGMEIGRSFSNSATGQKIVAYSALQLGFLYRQMGNLNEALLNYDEAIRNYDSLAFEVFAYDAHKGRLLCYTDKQDTESAKRELEIVLGLFEKYRAKILAEGNRNDFFNVEQSVYDLAIEFKFSKENDQVAALEYSEISRARSLLDLLSTRKQPSTQENRTGLLVTEDFEPLKPDELLKQIPEQSQVIQYAALENRVVIWVISRHSLAARSIDIPLSELTENVREYRRLVSSVSSAEDAGRQAAAVSLYKLLIRPVEGLLSHEKRLCIVPDKILNQLPFGTLVSSTSGRYLVEDFSLLHSPSSTIYVIESRKAQTGLRASERVLAVGNPKFDTAAFPSLPDLPAAQQEAEEICRFYDSKICLIGGDATKERVLKEMGQADVVHLAAHYLVDESQPMKSRLLLAKNTGAQESEDFSDALEVQDIYRLKSLATRMVVLSACLTSGERYYNGEGAVGFSRAFLAAQIPLVIASQWAVDSTATKVLMVNFHKHRRFENKSSVEALRHAQLEMLHGSEREYQRPYYWAPFIAIGGYAPY